MSSFNSKILWDVKRTHTLVEKSRTHLSRRVKHEVPALLSKVAGSKYTCKRLRVYEATKNVREQPLVRK